MSGPIAIFGATSGIGKCAMEEALRRGLPVRAFARSADQLAPAEHLETLAGDARDRDDVAAAVRGARAVIFALGIRERLAMVWEAEDLFSTSTKLLLEAMQDAGVRRLVVVTGFGAGRSRSAMSKLERLGHDAILGRIYADKTRQEALITPTDIDWTIARPVILNNRPASGKTRVLVDPKDWRNGIISRADVGAYLIDAVEQDLNIREDVVLTR